MDTLICAQLNTHHCKAAMAHLSLLLSHNNVDILFNQEPYCYNGIPCLTPSNYTPYYVTSNNTPRACIFIKSNIAHNFILLHSFSTADNVFVAMSTNPSFYIASSYLPPYDTLVQDLSPIQAFLNSMNPVNLIWGLDSNCKHNMWYSPITDARGRTLVEFLSEHGLITVNEKDGPTFSGAQGDSWIDITATTTNIAHRVLNWHVSEEDTQSDHNLINFNLSIRTSSNNLTRQVSNSTRQFATQVGNWKLFQHKIRQMGNLWMTELNNANTRTKLEDIIAIIWQQLNEINRSCFPPFLPTNNFKPWWSPQLNALRKRVTAAKRRAKRSKNPILQDIYKTRFKALRSQYKHELIKAKNESWKHYCTHSIKQSPWKTYKNFKTGFTKRTPPTTLTLTNGSSTSSEPETANALLDKFFPDDWPHLDNEEQRIIRLLTSDYRAADTQPELEFVDHEVAEIVTQLNDKKCPGPDGIDGAIVKNIHKTLPTFWKTVFNKCLHLGCFPKIWKTANVIAIPKTDRRKLQSVGGYRGISLLSIPGKCMEKLSMNRLNYFLQASQQLPPQQYGFTAGKSTVDAIKAVSDYVHQCKRLQMKSCLLALDFVGAFDNAWHPNILARLRELNCPSNIFNIIKDFLQDRIAHFSLGKTTTSKVVTKGCPQGSVTGPTLWNVIVSGLIAQLSNVPDLELVVYADDILLMFRGPSHPYILSTLQTALQITHDWCNKNKLEISKEKSVLMPMYIRKKEEYTSHPTVTAWDLNVVAKMKYLGIMLDNKMDWYPHMQYLDNKIMQIRNSLLRCSKATWGMSFHHLITIYNHAILPVIMYAAEVWRSSISRRANIKLHQIQRQFLIFATKAYRTVSNNALQAIACSMPIDAAVLLHNDIKATSRGQPTNAVIPLLKKTEIPTRSRGIHPRNNHILIDTSGSVGKADVLLFTDGSKTQNHVGAAMVVEEDSKETFFGIRRLDINCTVFQAELLGIMMAVEWIEQHANCTSTYAIHVDSKAAILAAANKRTTHPLAVKIRQALTTLKSTKKITLHWIKGHSGLQGNERADYLARIAASYRTTIDYKSTPLHQAKQLLTEYYTTIWNSIYTNSEDSFHTKLFIPNIPHRLSSSLWPNFITTQFITNHGRFKSYLNKMNITTSPLCNCSEKPPQTARHLLTECTRYSRHRPAVLRSTPLSTILKHHWNTVEVTEFLKTIFHSLQ